MYDKRILYSSFLYGQKFPLRETNLTIILPIKPSLELFLQTIETYLCDNKEGDLIWNIKHQEILYLFTKYYNKDDLYKFFYPLYSDFVSFKSLVFTHADSAKDCRELAERCGYGLKTFRRTFKLDFGKPALQWLHERKAAQIKHQILSLDISFKEIIYQFNFTSASHFNKFCKKNLGETPTNLREKFAYNYSDGQIV